MLIVIVRSEYKGIDYHNKACCASYAPRHLALPVALLNLAADILQIPPGFRQWAACFDPLVIMAGARTEKVHILGHGRLS